MIEGQFFVPGSWFFVKKREKSFNVRAVINLSETDEYQTKNDGN